MPEPVVADLEALVERAVRQAITARRDELERLIRARLDEELAQLAGEVVAARLEQTNGAELVITELSVGNRPASEAQAREPEPALCARCGAEPRLPGRTVGRRCKNRDDTARQRSRRHERRRAIAADDAAEEPRIGRCWNLAGPLASPHGGSYGLDSPPAAAAAPVPAGISAGELARRARREDKTLAADELARWLLAERLATVKAGGLLVATARGLELAEAIST